MDGKLLMRAPGGAGLVARANLTLLLRPGEEPRLVFLPGLISDLIPGADAGSVRVCLGGNVVGEIPVCWENSK